MLLAQQQVEAATADQRVAAAKQEVASVSERIAADLRGSPASAVSASDCSLLQDLCGLIDHSVVEKLCSEHGLSIEAVSQHTTGLITKLQGMAQRSGEQGVDSKQEVGHRPPGTEGTVASMVEEGRRWLQAPPELFSVEEVLAQLPEDTMDADARTTLRERLEAQQAAKKLRAG